jgi:hypothetical protein
MQNSITAVIVTSFILGVTTVPQCRTPWDGGENLLAFCSSTGLVNAPSTTEPRFQNLKTPRRPATQFVLLAAKGKQNLRISTIRRAENKGRDDDTGFHDGEIIHDVLKHADNPFLRRGMELKAQRLASNIKKQEIKTVKNTTSKQRSVLKPMSAPTTLHKSRKEDVFINETAPLHESHAPEDWHSSQDAYDAMFQELLSLKDMVDRSALSAWLDPANSYSSEQSDSA